MNGISSNLVKRFLCNYIRFSEEKYLKMEDCGDFSDMRLDQRFEVRNDEIASICSKFSQGITCILY